MTMATVTNVNIKVLVGLLLVGSAALYSIRYYYASPGIETMDQKVEAGNSGPLAWSNVADIDKLTAPWKTKAFEDIPRVVRDRASASAATIQDKNIAVTVDGQTDEVFYRENLPAVGSAPKATPLLLLHGAAFTSQNWVDTGTMALASAMGYRVVAVDLPAHGNTKTSNTAKDKAKFLEAFTTALDLKLPVIVSPSMSGGFALPYILGDAAACGTRVSGYIPIAPAGHNAFTSDQYKACQVPVLIVYGSNDKGLGESSLSSLTNFPSNGVAKIEDAGHPCYIDKPDIWHLYLYNYMSQVAK